MLELSPPDAPAYPIQGICKVLVMSTEHHGLPIGPPSGQTGEQERKSRLMAMRKLMARIITPAAIAIAILGSAAPVQAAAADHNQAHLAQPLPGCLVTFVPPASSSEEPTCLLPSSTPNVTCSPGVQIHEHGPVGNPNGWHLPICKGAPGLFRYELPEQYDNKASAWSSFVTCGYFHPNDGTNPPWSTFIRDSAGTFPDAVVGNDDLESISMWDCA